MLGQVLVEWVAEAKESSTVRVCNGAILAAQPFWLGLLARCLTELYF